MLLLERGREVNTNWGALLIDAPKRLVDPVLNFTNNLHAGTLDTVGLALG